MDEEVVTEVEPVVREDLPSAPGGVIPTIADLSYAKNSAPPA